MLSKNNIESFNNTIDLNKSKPIIWMYWETLKGKKTRLY